MAEFAGVGRLDGATWIAGGVGHVRERTIELGASIIAVDNIATMQVTDQTRNFAPGVFGALAILVAIFMLFQQMLFWAFPIFAVGLGLIVWTFLDRADVHLTVGTSDGRRTHIVSKNREFLVNVRDLIREKIDTQNVHMTGAINITAGRFEATAPR